MNPACSASLLMNDTDVRFHLLHTYILKRVMLAGVFSIKKKTELNFSFSWRLMTNYTPSKSQFYVMFTTIYFHNFKINNYNI